MSDRALLDAADDLLTISEHVDEGEHLDTCAARIRAWAEMLEAVARGGEVSEATAFALKQGMVDGRQHSYEAQSWRDHNNSTQH